jgi:cytochrome c biogenesis protein CcmG/thiol:disulfide interchange protein DsbE
MFPSPVTCALLVVATLAGGRPGVGDVAPSLELDALDGKAFRQSQLLGRVTVVDFSATWCRPCREARRDLATILGDLGPRIHVVLVDVGEDPALVRRSLDEERPPIGTTVLLDRDGAAARRWGQDRFPTTFLLDESGVIRHINRGWGAGYRERVIGWLRRLLTGAARAAPPL